MSNYSSYPNSFPNGVLLRGVPVQQSQPGEVFWVNGSTVLAKGAKGGSNGNTGTYLAPCATIDGAINKCTAGRGDLIMVMPSHTETLADATSLVADISGVAIIGLGSGSLRPTLTLSAAGSSITVSAANVSIKNVIITSSVADVADAFTLSAVNFHVEDCKFTQDAADENIIELVDTGTTDNECDGLSFLNCEWIEADAATTSMVNVDADLDRLSVVGCYIDLGVNGVLSAIAEVAAGKDLTNITVMDNYVSRLVTASAVQLITFVDTTTTNTGRCEGNRCRSLDVAGELIITAGTNISYYDNLTTSAIDKSGYILPVIDA
jgi:hypothetical protein